MSTPGPAGAPAPPATPTLSGAPAPTVRGWTISSFVLVAALIVIAVGFTVLWLRWDDFTDWSNPRGNAASVLGLAVSLIGFFLALLTMWDTQRINRRAQAEVEATVRRSQQDVEAAVRGAQEAVKDAYRQTRLAMEKTAMVLLVSEVENLRRLIVAVRDSGEAAQWQRASFQCQEATLLIPHLSGNPSLLRAEEDDLRGAAEALGKALRYINGRLTRNQLSPGLPHPHSTNIEETIQGVSAILSRLRKLSMEAPHAP
jgi:hypothetical protein